jgi:dihydrofolate synthase / folylpolyglutamate synthase
LTGVATPTSGPRRLAGSDHLARNEGPRVNYREAISYIIDRSGYDKGFVANPFDAESVGLRRTEALLRMLDFPDSRYPTVHIAGSKGKGSTAAAIASILGAAGYRTGLYTTPHLHTFRERIQINGEPISEEDFGRFTGELVPLNERLAREHPEWGEATAFEASTALAFLAFARTPVDIGIIEVGLGGRLDATNVIKPLISVIASISLDHTSILGETLDAIAREKGGIIKEGRPVVAADLEPVAAGVIEEIARDRNSRLILGGRDWRVHGSTRDFTVEGPRGIDRELAFGLAGKHQIENAGLAVTAVHELAERGYDISPEALHDGLRHVRWPGRFETVSRDPLVVVDGAHNVDSVARLVETLHDEFPDRRVSFVVGIARDKDIQGMLATLTPAAHRLIATASRSPRAAAPERLIEIARELSPSLETGAAGSVAEALRTLASAVDAEREIICVTGSLYAVAEAREAVGLAEPADFEQELLYR